jgi:mevalonate kinase
MAKRNVHAEENIGVLDLDSNVLKVLQDNNINTIGSLWELNKKKLKEMGISDSDIKLISIKLQLLGLDLNKKVYN